MAQEAATNLECQLAQAQRELSEALERQAATDEVLRVISSSPGELEPVFQAMLANATKICGASYGAMWLREGDAFRVGALHGPLPPAYLQTGTMLRPGPDLLLSRVTQTGKAVQVTDLRGSRAYLEGDPLAVAGVDVAGVRTLLGVPMLKERELVGVIAIYRQEVRQFTDKQIELVTSFARQALIAIENTRLLNELRESLQQQTATADVLKVISRSTFDTQPVFETIIKNAAQLCQSVLSAVYRSDGELVHLVAHDQFSPESVAAVRTAYPAPIKSSNLIAVAVRERRVVHIADVLVSGGYTELQRTSGYRSILVVPMIRDDVAIGAIAVMQLEPRLFPETQVELLKTFASQAVIAIDSLRLFNELRQRTDDLSESLQQQTATADMLKVISRSTFDLQTVLDTLVESAAQLCDADQAMIRQREGGVLVRAVGYGYSPEFTEYTRTLPLAPGRGTAAGRALLEGKIIHIRDVRADPEYTWTEAQRFGGFRTVLAVPMLRESNPIGVLTLTRSEVRPFTDKHIELATTFADQAVIAMENVRLFDEVQARTRELSQSVEELRALGEVSQAVNSTVDLEIVLTTIVAKATQLSSTEAGAIYVFDDANQEFRLRATYGLDETIVAELRDSHIRIGDTAISEAVEGRVPIQIPDLQADPSATLDVIVRAGFRALLIVPLLSPNAIVGALVVRRKQPGEFPKSAVELLQTFAAQSVLAIQNARLFSEIEDKSRQLAAASQHKSQFLANMSHELRTPLNAILGYNQLMLNNIYGETSGKMRTVLARVQSNGKHLLKLINDVLDLSKIEAGQLTLSLTDYSIKQVVQNVSAAVEPLVNEKKLGFKSEVASELPPGRGDERRLTQVLFNLVANAIKFTEVGEVIIKVSAANSAFIVSVRDTGPGIDSADQGRIFEEFQQADSSITKKTGGTGLGLSIARHIIEMHGGRIWVESSLGKGATFSFTVPVRAQQRVSQA